MRDNQPDKFKSEHYYNTLNTRNLREERRRLETIAKKTTILHVIPLPIKSKERKNIVKNKLNVFNK